MKEATFGLSVRCGEVFQLVDGVDTPFNGFPCAVWFTSSDQWDGYGWNRALFEIHGKVLVHYLTDVRSDEETEAVLCEVNNRIGFLALAEVANVETKKPTNLDDQDVEDEDQDEEDEDDEDEDEDEDDEDDEDE